MVLIKTLMGYNRAKRWLLEPGEVVHNLYRGTILIDVIRINQLEL